MRKYLIVPACALAVVSMAACAWATPASSGGLNNVCKTPVDHVQIEQGHISPPILLMPDVGAYGETPQQEWNYIGNTKDTITVHCFPTPGNVGQVDITLPAGVTHCVLTPENIMTCGN